VTVVQVDASNAVQPAQRSGELVSEHRTALGDPDRKLVGRPRAAFVDENVVRAVHWPQHQPFAVALHDREHRVGVSFEVAGPFVQLGSGDRR
jgi:hypothetical protein